MNRRSTTHGIRVNSGVATRQPLEEMRTLVFHLPAHFHKQLVNQEFWIAPVGAGIFLAFQTIEAAQRAVGNSVATLGLRAQMSGNGFRCTLPAEVLATLEDQWHKEGFKGEIEALECFSNPDEINALVYRPKMTKEQVFSDLNRLSKGLAEKLKVKA